MSNPTALYSPDNGEVIDISSTDHVCTHTTRQIWVGTGGNLNVTFPNGQTLLIPNVPVGPLDIQVNSIVRSSTTASNLVALF